MSSIEESKELSFGIASMDREHLGQLSLLNDLKAAVRNGADDSLVLRYSMSWWITQISIFSPNSSL